MKLKVLALLAALFMLLSLPSAGAASTGGSGGPLTDRTFLSYTGSRYTSRYHLYAAGLDWSKPVGLLVYADGSGEYGLKNPGSSYLMAGAGGMVAVAKRHNMVLLTPFAPNTACSDGGGSCWYLGDPVGYAKWAEELVTHVQGLYDIDDGRVAFGGYSSGAQLTTEYWAPSGAAQRTMTDGVLVAISYGGSPKVAVNNTEAFKAAVPIVWDTGDQDAAYTTTSSYGVRAGYEWYTANGFQTHLTVVPGLGHGRSGQFGAIMEREIIRHVPSVPAATAPAPAPWQHTVRPTARGAAFKVNIPTGTSRTTVRVSRDFSVSSGWYLYRTTTGWRSFEFTRLSPCRPYQYRIEAGPARTIVASGRFTTAGCS